MRSGDRPTSTFERDAEMITIAPDQPAFSDGAEIVKGQLEAGGQHWQIVCLYFCAKVRHVDNITAPRARLPLEKQQRTFRNLRSTDRSAIEQDLPLI